MTESAAVFEPTASYRRGVESALIAAGFRIDRLEPSAAVVTLRDDASCELIEQLAGQGVPVVAILPEPHMTAHVHAFRHGAAGTAGWSDDPEDIARKLLRAVAGEAILDSGVARALAAELPDTHAPAPTLSEEEGEWLRALSEGTTVARLADDFGYSERVMFRRLHDLYERLGAANRSEAVVTAQRLGLLRSAAS